MSKVFKGALRQIACAHGGGLGWLRPLRPGRWPAAIAGVAALLVQQPARGQDFQPEKAGTFVVTLRATEVSPDASDPIVTAAGASTGLHVRVGDDLEPSLGLTYFVTDHLAFEAILGTTEHNLYADGDGMSLEAHRTWVLPPIVTLQYHPWPKARFSPYVGAGVSGLIYYGGANFNGQTVRLKDSVGGAVQAGFNYALRGPWALNMDVKKAFVESDATVDGGALRSNVHVDPWVISAGVARRF
jgi:outer membrane protein